MSDEENKNLKVIEFKDKKDKEEQTPEFVIKALETMLEKAKSGKLKTLIVHFNYQDTKDEPYKGETILWNEDGNPIEMLGFLDIMKSIGLEYVYENMHMHELE